MANIIFPVEGWIEKDFFVDKIDLLLYISKTVKINNDDRGKKMKKFAQKCLKSMVVIMMALLFSLPVYSTVGGKTEQIDSLMKHCHQNEQFCGTVLVAENGKVIYKKAFGMANREWETANTLDTRFRIGSMSKSFTAMLVMQLAREGKLKLEDTKIFSRGTAMRLIWILPVSMAPGPSIPLWRICFYGTRRCTLAGCFLGLSEKPCLLLIFPNVRANTRFAPTSDAGSRAIVGANLVFARYLSAKFRIAAVSILYLRFFMIK